MFSLPVRANYTVPPPPPPNKIRPIRHTPMWIRENYIITNSHMVDDVFLPTFCDVK
jgi:hypothetical protein